MQQRLRLSDTKLTGARALVRRCLLTALPVAAVVGAIGYVLPAHDMQNGEPAHSNFADGGVWSLFIFAATALCTYLLSKRGFGAGIVAGFVAAGGGAMALGPLVLEHLMQHVNNLAGETIFAIGLLGLFCIGAAALVAEPLLFVVERRRIERAAKPAELPVARIVTA
jgi:hypothetical protein